MATNLLSQAHGFVQTPNKVNFVRSFLIAALLFGAWNVTVVNVYAAEVSVTVGDITIDPSHYRDTPIAGLHNDFELVTGTAVVENGIVVVTAPSNKFHQVGNPKPVRYVGNTKYTFLAATDGINNDPESVLQVEFAPNSNIALFGFLAEADDEKYWLRVTRNYLYERFSDTDNQRIIGHYVDQLGNDPNPLGDFFQVLGKLDKLNSDANIGDQWSDLARRQGSISSGAKRALDQMSGSIHGTQTTVSFMNATVVNNMLFDVLRRNALQSGDGFQRDIWGYGYGYGGTTLNDGNAARYSQGFGGLLVGSDQRYDGRIRSGCFFSCGWGEVNSRLDEKSKSTELLGGVYLRRENNNGEDSYLGCQSGYYQFELGVGTNAYKVDRSIDFMNLHAKSKYDAFVWTVNAERGFDYKGVAGTLQPFIGLQYIGMNRNHFKERGANSLNLSSGTADEHSFRSKLGARWSHDFDSISVSCNAAWMHECLRPYSNVAARFSQFSDPSAPDKDNFSSPSQYTVRGNDPGREWAVVGVGVNHDQGQWRLFGGYDAFIGVRQTLHVGNIGFAYGW